MVNEIKGSQHMQVNNLVNQSKAGRLGQKGAGNASEKATVDTDRVKLTDTAEKLRALEEQVAHQPVVDSQRVASVKKAIADGTFQVNVNRTAEKMIALENMLQNNVGEK